MRYKVYAANLDGSNERLRNSHTDAPCWGRMSEAFFPKMELKHLSKVVWEPVPRFHQKGVEDWDDLEAIVKLFIRDFNDGELSYVRYPEEAYQIKVTIQLSDVPRAVTMLKLFMIRNLVEYVGNGIVYKHLVAKKIPNRLAMYVGASTYISVGALGVNLQQINMYMNDAQIHSTAYRWPDIKRFLYPRTGEKRHVKKTSYNANMIDPNSTFREARSGYRKGSIMHAIRNGKPVHNANTDANNLVFNNWDTINAFLSKMMGRNIEVTPA